jgi:hypothetical protein
MKRYPLTVLHLVLLLTCRGFVQAQPETIITVELTGGEHAGSYEVTQEDSICLYGTSNGDDWRTLYSPGGGEAGELSTTLLLIESVSENASGGTDFFFSAGFGEYSTNEYLEYILDPATGNGAGTVTVQRDGHDATLSVAGQTSAGVTVNATITCTTVLETNTKPKSLQDLAVNFAPDSSHPTGSLELSIADKSYRVQTGEEATCTRDFFGEAGLFGYSYYVNGYNSVALFIPNFEVGQNTSDFGFAIDTVYILYKTGEGSGTVTSTQEGNTLTLEVAATSSEGIPVKATLQCVLE